MLIWYTAHKRSRGSPSLSRGNGNYCIHLTTFNLIMLVHRMSTLEYCNLTGRIARSTIWRRRTTYWKYGSCTAILEYWYQCYINGSHVSRVSRVITVVVTILAIISSMSECGTPFSVPDCLYSLPLYHYLVLLPQYCAIQSSLVEFSNVFAVDKSYTSPPLIRIANLPWASLVRRCGARDCSAGGVTSHPGDRRPSARHVWVPGQRWMFAFAKLLIL